jgi:hypothetical protein
MCLNGDFGLCNSSFHSKIMNLNVKYKCEHIDTHFAGAKATRQRSEVGAHLKSYSKLLPAAAIPRVSGDCRDKNILQCVFVL